MPEDEKIYDAVEAASNTGKIRRGVNETTKAVEREKAKIVVLAKDVSPKAIIMHIPVLCEEKKIPCVEVPSRKELGEASGIGVSVSALAIVEEGDAKKIIEKLKQTTIIEETPKEEEKKETPKEAAPKKEDKPKEKETPKDEPKKEEKPAEKKET
ncbi:ribosomal L7Ae/L30e/S12e/Gadd45 family protein, partial [archaeon]|nr:ribosomal L7Ae/L30e/S12e/Gadd45 family protein [archaeon]